MASTTVEVRYVPRNPSPDGRETYGVDHPAGSDVVVLRHSPDTRELVVAIVEREGE